MGTAEWNPADRFTSHRCNHTATPVAGGIPHLKYSQPPPRPPRGREQLLAFLPPQSCVLRPFPHWLDPFLNEQRMGEGGARPHHC